MVAQQKPRFPPKVREFVKDMLAVDPKANIYQIMPMYEKYYHHKRQVVDRATSFSAQLNGSDDGVKLRMAIRIYNESVVAHVFSAMPPPPPIINEYMR